MLFFPPGVDLNLAKSKFQPFLRFSHMMWHKVGIKVQPTQQKHVHSSAKCSNSMDSIPVRLGMVINLPYTECLCCWWDIFKVKHLKKSIYMLTVEEMHWNAVQPKAQTYKLWAQGIHKTSGNQIHFANTPQRDVLAPLLFYSPSPGCFRCGSALQMHQECLYSKLNRKKSRYTMATGLQRQQWSCWNSSQW